MPIPVTQDAPSSAEMAQEDRDPARNIRPYAPGEHQFASLAQLKAWHREGTEHFLTYKEFAEEAEKAVEGDQWSEAELADLRKKGRVNLVFNHIAKNVYAVYGYRAENKSELEYLPKEQSDTEEAEIYTQVAKHFWDACLAEYELEHIKLSQYIVGLGWAYCGYERENPSKEPFKLERTPWREMRYDPKGQRLDTLDWRYCSRERWFELSDAQARFPKHAKVLEEYAERGRYLGEEHTSHDVGGDPYSPANTEEMTYLSERREVRIIETWYRQKKAGLYVKTPTGWEVFDAHNVDHQLATIIDPKALELGMVDCVYFATWCGATKLEEGPSDYDHPYFPYVPMWGIRDHKGRPQGAVQAQLDPQKSHNWAMSKLLWQAASNAWLVPDGTIEDRATFAANAARPDAIIDWIPQEHGHAPQRLNHGEAAALAGELADRALKDLSEIGGSPEAFRGQSSNESSGRAIARRQEGALRQQGLYFAEEQRAMYQIGVMWRSMIAAKVTSEKIIRIVQPNGTTAFAAVNVEDPLRRAELEQQGYRVFGSVTRLNYDTKVVVSPLSATIREKQAAEQAMLNEMLSPDQLAGVSDIRVLATNIKDKEKIAERLAEMRQPQMPPGAPVGPDGMPLDPSLMGGPPPGPEMSTQVDNPNPDAPQPPEPMPGGFPMDPMMADPSLMAGEMAFDGGPLG